MKNKLKKLFQKTASGIKPGLEITENLAKNLGNPQNDFITIHIAGTNGKGSTASFLEKILIYSGFKTGLYTSPHLYDFSERIKVSGIPIAEKDLENIFELTKQADNKEIKATFFEFTTAMAFKYFSLQKTDVAVIETGMGGRYDSTNIITPHLSIITNVSIDHTDYLGSEINDIAYEKAGIIKKNIPVISGCSENNGAEIIKTAAENKNAPLYLLNKDFKYIKKKNLYFLNSYLSKGILLEPAMEGSHQIINAVMAGFSCCVLNKYYPETFNIQNKIIEQGIKDTKWRGRLEKLSDNPEIIADCAHNPESVKSLYNYLSEKNKKVILVFGSLKDKEYKKSIEIISPVVSRFIFTRPDSERAVSPEFLQNLTDTKSYVVKEPLKALRLGLESASRNDIVCVAGSIYLTGLIIEAFDKNLLKNGKI